MKRILTGILAILYLCISTGFTVHQHFCMGKFIGASLMHSDDEGHECSHCGMEKKSSDNGCCKDEHKVVKADDEHVGAKVVSLPAYQLLIADLPQPTFLVLSQRVAMLHTEPTAMAHAPPLSDRSCPLFIQHCSFLI